MVQGRGQVGAALVTHPGIDGVAFTGGTDTAAATRAVAAVGLTQRTTFDKIGVVVARGTQAQIQSVRSEPGVTYVEGGEQPIRVQLAQCGVEVPQERMHETFFANV